MDGVDVWARTLAQMMAKSKPQDTWELLPQEDLVSGRLDSTGYQYRLRGLSRLQCGRCQWGWSSAHVYLLFHLWWDGRRRRGLVKMRLWGQPCRLCPPDARGCCQVSLLNVRLFLNKLVVFVLQKCYREELGPDQCPEVCFGERCEACGLGVCFLQKPPDPDWGPEVQRPRPIKGRCTLYRGRGWARPVPGPPRSALGSIPTPFPASPSSPFFSQDAIVTVPFSLAGLSREEGALPAGGDWGPVTIGKGSIYLPSMPKSAASGQSLPVCVVDPTVWGGGALHTTLLEGPGFVFQGRRLITAAGGEDRQAPASSNRPPAGMRALHVPYVFSLLDSGEGSITFPLSLVNAVTGEDPVSDVGGTVTFPFAFTGHGDSRDSLEGREGEVVEDGAPLLGNAAPSTGFISIPSSIFHVIKRKGALSSRRRRRLRARRSSWEFHREGLCCRSQADSYEEVWIWVSTIFFILWVIYLHQTSADDTPRL